MRRSRITPILASRDPNITPALLKRKFHKGVKVEYPSLTDRVAYSEAELDRGMPRALLFREGLLPYAEAVVGSRRLCKAVRRATALSVLGSAAGTLLAFYLVFQGAYNLLTPLALLVFLLLWTLPVLITVGLGRPLLSPPPARFRASRPPRFGRGPGRSFCLEIASSIPPAFSAQAGRRLCRRAKNPPPDRPALKNH